MVNKKKNYQYNKILYLIRTNPNVSKNVIKRITSYSMTTITGVVSELIKSECIYEEVCEDPRVGRRPVWLRINPDYGYFIGIEFNRRQLCCAVLNFKLEKIYYNSCSISDDQKNVDSILELLIGNVQDAMNALKENAKKIIGIGIGIPGYINQSEGMALSYNHFDKWKNVPIREIVQNKFHLPCYIDNNVNVMIYPYKWLKYNGRCEDMLFISVRTGARVIPVIRNQPVKSSMEYAGEIGHIKVHNASRLCSCGRFGCLNSEISDVAVINKIKEGMSIGEFNYITSKYGKDVHPSIEKFIESVMANDEDAIKLLERSAMYLGQVLAALINIFAPKKVVIYGIYAPVGDLFIRQLKDYTSPFTIEKNFHRVSMRTSTFGPELGAMGAAILVMEEVFAFADEVEVGD